MVRRIPKGKVATYGQIAALTGHPRAARAVGRALRNLPPVLQREVPWHRVLNSSGAVSIKGDLYRPEMQRELLEREGVSFDRGGRVSLKARQWRGGAREQRSEVQAESPLLTTGRVRLSRRS